MIVPCEVKLQATISPDVPAPDGILWIVSVWAAKVFVYRASRCPTVTPSMVTVWRNANISSLRFMVFNSGLNAALPIFEQLRHAFGGF